MLHTHSELLEKIRLGEYNFLELKAVRFTGGKLTGPTQDNLADELAAFANSNSGGILLLGVQDNPRAVVGIPIDKLDAVESLVKQACEDSINPTLASTIERMTLPDTNGNAQAIIRVAITSSLLIHQSPGGYLQRIGSSKRPIPPEQLARLFQQRSQSRLIRFDETPVARASLSELDPNLWQRFAPTPKKDTEKVLLNKLAMATCNEQNQWHPTVAGLLMGSHTAHQFLPNAFIQAVAYQGTNIAPATEAVYQRDAQDITGPLDQQIFKACAFVRKNMQMAAHKYTKGGRKDRPQFNELAVFEAITNAVAHRDYSMAGTKIRLRLFNDRLELYSPGMLPNTMTPETWQFRQATRNEVITSLLARCPIENRGGSSHREHIMDKRGEGVPIILDSSEQLSGKLPVYRLIDESELLLTIYGAYME